MIQETSASVMHVRFEGRSFDLPLADLDVGPITNDDGIRQAVADYLEVAANRLNSYVVDRHDTGNLTLRPQAVYG